MALDRVLLDWRGFLIARDPPAEIDALYATRIRVREGWLVELAGTGDAGHLACRLLPRGERIEALDAGRGQMRFAVVTDGRLAAALFLTRGTDLPRRDWLIDQLTADRPPGAMELVAGRPVVPPADRGAIVCAWFDVGMNTLAHAISKQRLTTVQEVGAALRAGTNCGSCRTAIDALLRPKVEGMSAWR